VRMMLRISPGSSRTAVISRYLDGWKLSVGAVPERGNANEEIVSPTRGCARDPEELR
jgi:uncharacterized protein YggU (UPF0235/DUF167 family)